VTPPARRLALVREALATADLDALLVSHLPSIRWLTGFSGSSGLVLVSARELVLLTDFRYATQVEEEVAETVRVVIVDQSLWAALWEVLGGLTGVQRVGFESAYLLHRDFQRLLEQGARWHWRPTLELLEPLREQKDATEIAAIRRAIRMAERALARVLAVLAPGQRETEVAGRLEAALRDEGSEGFPFPCIVASGPRAALPHARAGSRPLARGDLVLLDFGAIADGYCSDITRTVVVGRATVEQREIHAIVREANARATAGIRPGMRGQDADALAREYIAERGFGEAFGHSLGHGIGLEVHEGPRLARTADSALRAGAVVTIEPGIYRAGWGGIRIEDDILLTSAGAEVLTQYPRELLEIV
jgi:Xaa-Pro aminopeptidase